jgi:hypothetical protein
VREHKRIQRHGYGNTRVRASGTSSEKAFLDTPIHLTFRGGLNNSERKFWMRDISRNLSRSALGLALLSGLAASTANGSPKRFQAIASGCLHTCALVDDQVFCWGENAASQTTIPPTLMLKRPTAVATGCWHSCALDEEGVKCWGAKGRYNHGQADVPPLKNPRAISAGQYHTCAIDDDGVKCWGMRDLGQTDVPPNISQPVTLFTGSSHINCVVDADGVKCWGRPGALNFKNPYPPATIRYPTVISYGNLYGCALDKGLLTCWGDAPKRGAPILKNPRMITTGSRHICALDDNGVKCWDGGYIGPLEVPTLVDPIAIAGGWSHTCAVDKHGVHCWGDACSGKLKVPPYLKNWQSPDVSDAGDAPPNPGDTPRC